mgnify:CR=1 FL=1
MNKTLKKIIKFTLIGGISFFSFAGAAAYYQYTVDEEKIDTDLKNYKLTWANNSQHQCKLKSIKDKNKLQKFVVTSTNINKFHDGRLTLQVKKDALLIQHNKLIEASQTIYSNRRTMPASYSDMDYGLEFYEFSANEYGYGDQRFILGMEQFFVEYDNGLKVKEYNCSLKHI